MLTLIVLSLGLVLYSSATAAGELAPWPYIIANVAVATVLLSLARLNGLSLADLGMSGRHLRNGLWSGGRIAAAIIGPVVGGALIVSQFFPRTADQAAETASSPATLRDVLFKIFVHILIGTALAEEVMFRGALLAIWTRARGLKEAAIGSSLAFACWHIVPSIVNESARNSSKSWVALYTVGSVIAMFLAGLFLARLRRRTQSLMAPFLVHAAVNGSLVAAGYIAS